MVKTLLLVTALACAVVVAETKRRTRETSEYTIGPSVQPLVIYGEGWTQKFTIINVDYYQGGEPTVGTLRFYTRDGLPWRIPLKGRSAVDEIPVTLQPGQMFVLETEVSQQPQQLGWLSFTLSSNVKQWGIYHAFTTFRKETPGRTDLMTTVPFVDGLEDEVIIPMDNRDGKYPGIGLVNSSTASGTFTLQIYDSSGVRRRDVTRTVRGLSLDWFSLLADYPDLVGIDGQIRVRGPFLSGAAFTLQFAPNGAFTALPVVHTFGLP